MIKIEIFQEPFTLRLLIYYYHTKWRKSIHFRNRVHCTCFERIEKISNLHVFWDGDRKNEVIVEIWSKYLSFWFRCINNYIFWLNEVLILIMSGFYRMFLFMEKIIMLIYFSTKIFENANFSAIKNFKHIIL